MTKLCKSVRALAPTLGLLALLVPSSASATPITYNAQLFHGMPVIGTTTQPDSNPNNPEGAEYCCFFAVAGAPLDIFGDRLHGPYDMSWWILGGLFADTDDFGGSFDITDSFFVEFGDDEDPPNLPGPFGDPHTMFIAPATGFYTLAVTNFFSDGPPPFDFRITANGVSQVPEPATLALCGLVALGLAGYASGGERRFELS